MSRLSDIFDVVNGMVPDENNEIVFGMQFF